MERFDAESALAAIQHHGVTTSQWVPTMFIRMLKLPAEVRAKYDLATLRRAVHSAAPCPIWAKEQMIEWWGPIVAEYYSGSENIGMTTIESAEWLAHKGSVGRPAYGEVHICDDTGVELPVGEDGLVYFYAPATVFEYHGDADKTASIFHPTEPWRTLGDIGHLDADGYLYLSDRATFMIISGGVNIYPQEVENLLLEHPRVVDAAVFGIPHEELGEVPMAVVQPGDGSTAGLQDELVAWCRGRLSSYKVPARIELRSELPRGEDGKLRKKPLRAEHWPPVAKESP
jgi:long-chain acyl-CoA synthetase